MVKSFVKIPKKVKILIVAHCAPAKPDNYFYRTLDPKYSSGGNNSFFSGIMKAFGFLQLGQKIINTKHEKKLLMCFLDAGYFLIDSHKKPSIVDVNLLKEICTINPDRIIFLTKNNDQISQIINQIFPKKIIKNGRSFCFPYPGNSHLNTLIKNLPQNIKSNKLC